MAQIDFSNAKIEVNDTATNKPISISYFDLQLSGYFLPLYYSGTQVATASVASYRSQSNMSCRLTGTITASDISNATWFTLGRTSGDSWKISDISYSTGDEFDFYIDFDIAIV